MAEREPKKGAISEMCKSLREAKTPFDVAVALHKATQGGSYNPAADDTMIGIELYLTERFPEHAPMIYKTLTTPRWEWRRNSSSPGEEE